MTLALRYVQPWCALHQPALRLPCRPRLASYGLQNPEYRLEMHLAILQIVPAQIITGFEVGQTISD